jgi:6-pyruvoyl-tetrahydropterin synthase
LITISDEVEFDAGHRIPGTGPCRSPHGHRYSVRVTCEVTGAAPEVGALKNLMARRVGDVLDRAFIVYEGDAHMRQALLVGDLEWQVVTVPQVPTVDGVAQWVWDHLDEPITEWFDDDLALLQVEVWETPTSVATVERDPEPVREPITVNVNGFEKCKLERALDRATAFFDGHWGQK